MFFRYLLLSLLPLIIIIIYFDGQNYDPVLLDFQKVIEGNRSIIDFLPKKNGAYQRVGQIRQYLKDDLYEYVNGHAEFFISYGFIKLASADYSSTNSNINNPEFVVDIYNMENIENAFGVLVEESGGNSIPVEIGFKGFFSQKTLNFIKGPYYIKISAYNDNAPLSKFARGLERLMGDSKDEIPQFKKFPNKGKVKNSSKFVKESYNGLNFANRVFEQKYKINGETFKAFLIEGNSNDFIAKLLNQYFQFFKEEDLKYKVLKYKNRDYYKVSDPFEGNWYLIPLDKDLFGIYGPISDVELKKFIESLV